MSFEFPIIQIIYKSFLIYFFIITIYINRLHPIMGGKLSWVRRHSIPAKIIVFNVVSLRHTPMLPFQNQLFVICQYISFNPLLTLQVAVSTLNTVYEHFWKHYGSLGESHAHWTEEIIWPPVLLQSYHSLRVTDGVIRKMWTSAEWFTFSQGFRKYITSFAHTENIISVYTVHSSVLKENGAVLHDRKRNH